MNIDHVNPDIRDAVARLRIPPFDQPGAPLLTNLVAALTPAATTPGTTATRIRNANLDARLIRPGSPPASPGGAVLWFHGGGFVTGDVKQDAPLLGRTSAELGIPTLSVRYPLAPRHRIQEMLQTAYRAWTWLVGHADELGARPDRLVVGGDSAGGQLASVLVQYIHDQGGQQPAATWLFAPATDDRIVRSKPEDIVRRGSHFVIDGYSYLRLVPRFSGHQAGDPTMPDYVFAGRREQLAGLPPSWLYCGSIELFHDEVVAYAHRLQEAGVPTELVVVDGAVHGFEVFFPGSRLAHDLGTEAIAWLRPFVAS